MTSLRQRGNINSLSSGAGRDMESTRPYPCPLPWSSSDEEEIY